jgi:PAS domain S-box-containing protein
MLRGFTRGRGRGRGVVSIMRLGRKDEHADRAANAVALLHGPGSANALMALLAELDPSTTSVVLWRVSSESDPAELHDIVQRAGFALQQWTDGACLQAGRLYITGADRRVWFEGAHLRAAVQRRLPAGALDRALQSLARSWGARSIVMASEGLAGDGERGLNAVRRAGGKVLTAPSADPDRAPPSRSLRGPGMDSVAPTSTRPPRPQRAAPPPFRAQRLFAFSSTTQAQLRATAAVAVGRAAGRDRVRVWVPACKTGGLAHAVAMMMLEVSAREPSPPRVQVFGTDPDEEALAVARAGRYPVSAALGMDPGLRARYTFDEGYTIRVSEAVREVCSFSPHKLTRSAPFSRIDLIVCDRVFQGLPPPRRDDLVDELYFALRDDGILFALARREYFQNDRFELMPEGYLSPRPTPAHALGTRVQRRARAESPAGRVLDGANQRPLMLEAGDVEPRASRRPLGGGRSAELEALVHAIGVPLILLNDQLNILHVSEETTSRFGLSSAARGLPLNALAQRLPGGAELLYATERAQQDNTTRELAVSAGDSSWLVRVSPARASGSGIAIVYTDISALEAAIRRALMQKHQQAAIARIGTLALEAIQPAELFEAALGMLLQNIPTCSAGLVVDMASEPAGFSVVASRGLGPDPLGRLRAWGEPYELLREVLDRATGDRYAGVDTREGVSRRFTRASEDGRSGEGDASHLGAGVAWPISNEGSVGYIIALYSRQSGVEDVEHRAFVQGMANVLEGGISRHRLKRRLTLELDVSKAAANATDLAELGHGVEKALRAALAAEGLEIWTTSSRSPVTWQRKYPEPSMAAAPAPWTEDFLKDPHPRYRAQASPDQPGELWVPVTSGGRPLAVLRARGPALRAPDRELSEGLVTSGRSLATFFERRQMFEALRASEASYRTSNAELDAVYASLPVGVSIHDPSGAVRRVNRHLSLTGEPTVIGDALLARLYANEIPAWVQRVLATGDSIHGLELSIQEADEARAWLCNLAAIRDLDGTLLGVSAVVQDITPIKQVEQNLREIDRQKDDFLALLGHELRNPIAAIRSATELLRRIDLPAPQLPRLQRILDRQSLQTTKLIDGLLDVARITRGKVELDTAPLDVVELVRQVIEDRRSQFRERRLEVQLAEPEVWIVADRVKLVQVLDNLLSNALKFSSYGGLVRVEVHAEENNGTIVICDDGVGIEPNLLPCIFEPFRQGRPRSPSAQCGLGLGLALVKGLVELHGYRLRAHSDGVGQGARFEIEFATTAPPSHSSPESSIQVRHLQVLLVEDNPDVAETLTELLVTETHDVQAASDAEAALAVLRSWRPDVILCDIGLPGMDGVAFAECVRADPELNAVCMIAMTGYGDATTRRRIDQAGFDRALIKPVESRALRSCLSRLSVAAPRRGHG